MESHKTTKILRSLMVFFALLGASFMIYLSYLHITGAQSTTCDISAELSCSIVNQSQFSEIVGIPIALLGLIYFLAIAFIAISNIKEHRCSLILLFSIFSLVYSATLSALEFFVISSFCLFCESSKIIMIILIVLSAICVKIHKEKMMTQWIIGAMIVGLLFSGVAYMLQTRNLVTKDYTNIAQCLTENNVLMYGTYWCPQCAKQRRLFGDASQYIHEIECDVRSGNAEAERCVNREIKKTPTWIQETQDGAETKRLQGATAPEELAKFFGCDENSNKYTF